MAVVIEEGVLTPLHRDMMQQAIEGINEKYKNAEDEYPIIEIDCFDITVWFVAENITEIFYFDKYDSINAAKRAALEYIFEKMGE
jgi:antitoxin component HigA of HigAB toxin-antitoxin module